MLDFLKMGRTPPGLITPSIPPPPPNKPPHPQSHPHGVDICIGGLALGHLDGGDPQGPDVCHAVVADLLDHLRGHPEGCADHRVTLGHGVLEERGRRDLELYKDLKTGRSLAPTLCAGLSE